MFLLFSSMHAFVLSYYGNGKTFLFQFFGKLQLYSLYLCYTFNCTYSQLTFDQSTRIANQTRGTVQSSITKARTRQHWYNPSTSPSSTATGHANVIIWISARRDGTLSIQSSSKPWIRTPSPATANDVGGQRTQPLGPPVVTKKPAAHHDSIASTGIGSAQLQQRTAKLWIHIAISG